MAWTEAGGEILFVEATKMQGKGNLSLTGSLGEVMKESAQAALSYARAHASDFGIDNRLFQQNDFHIHIPEGAIPKDGPSAGVTIATAFISLCTDTKVRWDVAMTGEITLRGNVLPVGGVKEKVLAAQRMGVKRMIMPLPNKKDLIDIPKNIRRDHGVHLRRGRQGSSEKRAGERAEKTQKGRAREEGENENPSGGTKKGSAGKAREIGGTIMRLRKLGERELLAVIRRHFTSTRRTSSSGSATIPPSSGRRRTSFSSPRTCSSRTPISSCPSRTPACSAGKA